MPDLAACLPHFLGYIPRRALLVVAVNHDGGTISAVLRVDLATPETVVDLAAGESERLVAKRPVPGGASEDAACEEAYLRAWWRSAGEGVVVELVAKEPRAFGTCYFDRVDP